ncbi:unnamed protein product, partial [Amoebophrya sp. A120]
AALGGRAFPDDGLCDLVSAQADVHFVLGVHGPEEDGIPRGPYFPAPRRFFTDVGAVYQHAMIQKVLQGRTISRLDVADALGNWQQMQTVLGKGVAQSVRDCFLSEKIEDFMLETLRAQLEKMQLMLLSHFGAGVFRFYIDSARPERLRFHRSPQGQKVGDWVQQRITQAKSNVENFLRLGVSVGTMANLEDLPLESRTAEVRVFLEAASFRKMQPKRLFTQAANGSATNGVYIRSREFANSDIAQMDFGTYFGELMGSRPGGALLWLVDQWIESVTPGNRSRRLVLRSAAEALRLAEYLSGEKPPAELQRLAAEEVVIKWVRWSTTQARPYVLREFKDLSNRDREFLSQYFRAALETGGGGEHFIGRLPRDLAAKLERLVYPSLDGRLRRLVEEWIESVVLPYNERRTEGRLVLQSAEEALRFVTYLSRFTGG